MSENDEALIGNPAGLSETHEEEKDARGCCCGYWDWCTVLKDNFGYKFLTLIFSTEHLGKGFVYYAIASAEPYLYALHSATATNIEIYEGVTALPWAIKPIMGLMSDTLPIFGYRKLPYMLIVTALASVCAFVVGVISASELPILLTVGCVFIMNYALSCDDLLTEGLYAERIMQKPECGSDVLSFVWLGLNTAGLLGILAAGFCIYCIGTRSVYILVAPLFAIICIPLVLNYTEESPVSPEDLRRIWYKYYVEQSGLCVLCFIMLANAIVLAIVALTCSTKLTACFAVLSLVILLVSFALIFSPMVAKFAAFSLLQNSLTLATSGAAYYFYTDDAEEYPEGPHFTSLYYTAVLGCLGTVFGILGVLIYQRYLTDWSYRGLLLMANLAYSISAMSDVILYSRLNVKIGIPDTVMCIGGTVMENTIYQWFWMPQVVILSYLCPKGMEATMYALLAGAANIGNTIADDLGGWLLLAFGVEPDGSIGESDQFTNLWKVSLIAVVLPFITVVLLFYLIPEGRQNEPLFDEDVERDVCADSLWRQMKKRWVSAAEESATN